MSLSLAGAPVQLRTSPVKFACSLCKDLQCVFHLCLHQCLIRLVFGGSEPLRLASMAELGTADAEIGPMLDVKPFGAHGVRLLWSYSGSGPLVVEADTDGWVKFAECEPGKQGVVIVKEKGAQSWPWRLRSPSAASQSGSYDRV